MSDENDRDASSTRPMKSFRGRVYVTVLFFPYHGFYPNGFFHDKVFNEAVRNSTVMDTQGGMLKIDKTLCDYPSQLVLQVNQRLSSYPNTTSSPSNSTIYTLVCSFVNVRSKNKEKLICSHILSSLFISLLFLFVKY